VTPVVASVVVAVPAEQAWSAMTDWVGQSAWIPLTTVAVLAGDGALGTRLSARTGVGAAAVVDTMQIDLWEPPHRCEVVHLGRVVRGRGVFEVEPVNAASARVTWSEQLDGLPARITAPAGRWALRVALGRFARSLAPA
jgi:hypothetical protein